MQKILIILVQKNGVTVTGAWSNFPRNYAIQTVTSIASYSISSSYSSSSSLVIVPARIYENVVNDKLIIKKSR